MIFGPLCMRCKKNLATVKITKIVNGKVEELNLCKECAAEVSPYQKKINESQANIADIIQKLISSSAGAKEQPQQEDLSEAKVDVTCQRCGLSFEQYRKSFFLGCSDCYTSFEKYLVSDLRRLHGSVEHIGKIPVRFRERFERIKRIKQIRSELEGAIEEEQYEKAAELRDRIRALEEESDR